MGGKQNSDQTQPGPSTQSTNGRIGNSASSPPAALLETMEDVKEKVRRVLEYHINNQRRGLKLRFFKDGLDKTIIDQATEMLTVSVEKGCGLDEIGLSLPILVLYDLVILIG